MNVVTAYLDTMFASYPSSPRMLEAKNELHGMMEDAYTGYIAAGVTENEAVGRVITEFGNLDEVAPLLGITAELAGPADPTANADRHPIITQTEAEAYAAVRKKTEPRLATAIMLFVLSPVLLVSLSSLGASTLVPFDENTGSLIGLIALVVLVATGIMIILGRNQQLAPFAHIDRGHFTRSAGVELWARTVATQHASRRTRSLQIAIALFVLSVVPVWVMSMVPGFGGDDRNALSGVGVGLLLIMVATGLRIFVPANWAASTAEALAGKAPSADTEGSSIVGVIAAIYWPLLVAIFLAWGLIGDAWDRAWIIWPIGAVLFGAIAGGFGAWEAHQRNRAKK